MTARAGSRPHEAARRWYDRFGPDLRELHLDAGLSHGLAHVARVTLLAARIAEAEEVPQDPCVLAALFHDCGHAEARAARTDDHELRSARTARDRLGGVLPEAELADVLDAIAGRRFAKLDAARKPMGAVLDDADNLDAIGPSGVARAYLWLGERHRAQAERLRGDDLAAAAGYDLLLLRRHWDEKLAFLRGRMRTATGIKLAELRHTQTAAFLDRLAAETDAL